MRRVGTFEAKTHFTEMLRAAEAGETITITKRGADVAILGPIPRQRLDRNEALKRLAQLRERLPRADISEIREWINEGRR